MSSSILSQQTVTLSTLAIKWFYAVDIPNSRPSYYNYVKTKEPQKFIPFSDYDSFNLENTFQKSPDSKIPVSEDKLFEADLSCMEMFPIFWEGPRYEIRRGLWFTDKVPLPTHESIEIDRGYDEIKPYLFNQRAPESEVTSEQLRADDGAEEEEDTSIVDTKLLNDMYLLEDGRVVLYFNDRDAFIVPASYLGKFHMDVVRKIGSNSYLGILRISRGYKTEEPETEDKEEDDKKPEKVKETPKDKQDDHDTDDCMEHDFNLETSQEEANREIDHLVFCVHGIGQIMGNKNDAYTFSHSVNLLRKTIKKVFTNNPEYQKLVGGNNDSTNTKIQVLPISWRHKVTFNPTRAKSEALESRLPTLSQINVDGITYIREILGDVGCDILLYYEKEYLLQMLTAVTSELNRVYQLYKERNPKFNGKVHILGHSLGSAISFDILCGQSGTFGQGEIDLDKTLAFDVDKLFLVGSPVGIFKLIERKNIVGRSIASSTTQPANEYVSPRCNNVYNLYHPCDPIAYRMEPLVNPKFGDFKAAYVPFESKVGFNSRFEMVSKFTNMISTKLWETSKQVKKKGDGDDVEVEGSPIFKKRDLNGNQLRQLTSLNLKGRVDYSLPMGMFDISLVSALAAHIGYFEDQNTVGFLIRELLAKRDKAVESKVVSIY
ncbi:hypothetical protein Cantr_03922 [Candida viswanathii]|uniref:DDHD domain-containing protein n=1 Tax=Candida viswanathii TaxID=5486 RepID=A0A367XPG1_9ASCO|nr:hypothetical protein Cantr_03922 [Candida viswanathii]